MEFRCARHTDNFADITAFYTDILGLQVLFSFEGHRGYAGVLIGKPDTAWHLEFTTSAVKAEHHFDPEDLLVFYPSSQEEYDHIIGKIETNNIKKYKAANPYWNDNGVFIKDPDGFGVIISNVRIQAS